MENYYDFIDAFAPFEKLWLKLESLTPIEQEVLWLSHFTHYWPELARMYTEAHVQDGEEWSAVLRERFFPRVQELLPSMRRAAEKLPEITREVVEHARLVQILDFSVRFVMLGPAGYAGWGTRYDGCRACLFGLDTIADLGWEEQHTLTGLVAHELGHLIHAEWRERQGLACGRGPFWSLYQEGFAQCVEHLVTGPDSWLMEATTPGWASWCSSHVEFLASEFLAAVRAEEPLYRFFGSLPHLHVAGHRQTGYFLGGKLVGHLGGQFGFREIALLEPRCVDESMNSALEKLATV